MGNFYKPKKGGTIRLIPPILTNSSGGIQPTYGKTFYTRKIITNDDILEQMDIKDIERFLRKKKLQKLWI